MVQGSFEGCCLGDPFKGSAFCGFAALGFRVRLGLQSLESDSWERGRRFWSFALSGLHAFSLSFCSILTRPPLNPKPYNKPKTLNPVMNPKP